VEVIMTIDKLSPMAAANAYSSMQKTAASAGGDSSEVGGMVSLGGAGGSGGGSFGDMLKQVTSSSIDSLKAGEKASASAITGKADLTDVVQALTGAETTLDTVVAVRDRMLSAYDKIMQMSI
jgi:flagellar hook-basal body complex protein FliE